MQRRFASSFSAVVLVLTSAALMANQASAAPKDGLADVARPLVTPQPLPGKPGAIAPISLAIINRDADRLKAIRLSHPGGDGGMYFDEATGRLVLRIVPNEAGYKLKEEALRKAEEFGVPITFQESPVTIDRVEAAARQLAASRMWAGQYADDVIFVRFSPRRARVQIAVRGHEAEISESAAAATGLEPYVVRSPGGGPQDSRA